MIQSICADRYLEINRNFFNITYHFQKRLENYKTYVFHSLHRPIHEDNGRCNHQADLCKFQHGDMGCCHSHLHQFHILHLTQRKQKTKTKVMHGKCLTQQVHPQSFNFSLAAKHLIVQYIFILRTSEVVQEGGIMLIQPGENKA